MRSFSPLDHDERFKKEFKKFEKINTNEFHRQRSFPPNGGSSTDGQQAADGSKPVFDP